MTKPSLQRFTRGERWQHILLFCSLVVLALTGLSLMFHDSAWGQFMIRLEGGLAGRGLIHRLSAVVLIGVALYHHFYLLLTNRGHSLLQGLLFRSGDLKRVFQGMRYHLGRSSDPANWGKFTLFQKLQYFGVSGGVFTMIITGVVLWLGPPAIALMPKWVMDLTLIVHGSEGLLIFIILLFWHLYNVHLSPGNFPMNWSWINGKISIEELHERHPAEYRRLVQSGEIQE